MTPPIDLDALRSLCDASSPAPWSYDDGNIIVDACGDDCCPARGFNPFEGQDQPRCDEDSEFVAAARNAMPALLAELAAARSVVSAACHYLDTHLDDDEVPEDVRRETLQYFLDLYAKTQRNDAAVQAATPAPGKEP